MEKETKETIEEIDYKALYEEEHNKYLRALADYENLKRNTNKRIDNITFETVKSMMKSVIAPVYNDIKRGVENNVDGCQNILRKMVSILEFNNFEILSDEGKDFNEETMDAIFTQPTDNEELKGKVDIVYEDGFRNKNTGEVVVFEKVAVYC